MRETRLTITVVVWLLVGTIGCLAISHQIGPVEWKDKLAVWGVALTFWTSLVSAYIVAVNAREQMLWTRDMERLKAILGLQYPAYRDAMSGVVRYYDALSRLQNGRFDVRACEDGEAEMKKAMGTVYFLPEDFRDAWFKFWSYARYMKEAAEKWIDNKEAQEKFWKGKQGGVQLGKLQERIGKSMQQVVAF